MQATKTYQDLSITEKVAFLNWKKKFQRKYQVAGDVADIATAKHFNIQPQTHDNRAATHQG